MRSPKLRNEDLKMAVAAAVMANLGDQGHPELWSGCSKDVIEALKKGDVPPATPASEATGRPGHHDVPAVYFSAEREVAVGYLKSRYVDGGLLRIPAGALTAEEYFQYERTRDYIVHAKAVQRCASIEPLPADVPKYWEQLRQPKEDIPMPDNSLNPVAIEMLDPPCQIIVYLDSDGIRRSRIVGNSDVAENLAELQKNGARIEELTRAVPDSL